MKLECRCVWDVQSQLGEGPVWVPQERSVYFVDIFGCAIHRRDENGACRTWKTPAEPGFLFPMTGGGFVCGMRGGLYRFHPPNGAFDLLIAVDADKPQLRINDGFVDAAGRLWFGTMHTTGQISGGALYSLEEGPALRMHDSGYFITNGPAASTDGATLYHSDSARRRVFAFTHRAGRLTDKRLFIEDFADDEYPDGMAVDAEGHVWIAIYNGWRLERYSPQGIKIGELRLPCANPTKPVFGGADLHILYVTTARANLASSQLAEQPLAGGLFIIRTPVPGTAPTPINWQ